jgi:hypothetical protein
MESIISIWRWGQCLVATIFLILTGVRYTAKHNNSTMSDGTTPAFAFEPRQVATSLPIGRENAEALEMMWRLAIRAVVKHEISVGRLLS